ncbi:hypothetical protein ACA910_009996 [Epithemia clementina (nom. ined.)]
MDASTQEDLPLSMPSEEEPTPSSGSTRNGNSPPSRQVSNISLPNKKSGLFGTSSNMINSIVGAGIIGIPFALSKAGIVAGVLMFFLVAYLTDKSLRIIVELASFHPKLRNLGVLTYEDLARIPFGRFGAAYVLTVMFVLAYGAMVAYLLVIKDNVPAVLGLADAGRGSFLEAEVTMIVTSFIIILPLSMMRDMATLAKTSLLSVLADVFLTGFVIAYSPVKSTVSEAGGFGRVLKENWINRDVFIGLGIISFAMACQHSAFIVSNSLKDHNAERWATVTFRSVSAATFLCLLLGMTGYLGFLDETEGDILVNFDSDSIVANAGRVLLSITMFFTYPMEAFVARHVLVALFYNGDMDGVTIGPNGDVVPLPKVMGVLGRRHIITLVIYVATLIPALIVNDLGPVLSITGSLGASCIAYVASGALYLGINGEEFLEYCRNMLESRGYKVEKRQKPSEVELPVVGDATATMASPDSDNGTTDEIPLIPSGIKPFWWYLCLFPVWVFLASWGATGTRNFLRSMEGYTSDVDSHVDSANVIGPRKRDYYISMFLITFGILAAVVGVISNIYVEVRHIFYTPT